MQGKCLKERRGRDGVRSGNFLHNQRIVDRWSNRTSEPDYIDRYVPCQCCGLPIDTLYRIDGHEYCYDCAHEMCRVWLIDEESIECEGCSDMITDEECYYSVAGEPYCEECFERYFKE